MQQDSLTDDLASYSYVSDQSGDVIHVRYACADDQLQAPVVDDEEAPNNFVVNYNVKKHATGYVPIPFVPESIEAVYETETEGATYNPRYEEGYMYALGGDFEVETEGATYNPVYEEGYMYALGVPEQEVIVYTPEQVYYHEEEIVAHVEKTEEIVTISPAPVEAVEVEVHHATGIIPEPIIPKPIQPQPIEDVETYETVTIEVPQAVETYETITIIEAPHVVEHVTVVETHEEEIHYATGLIIPEEPVQPIAIVEAPEEEYHYATGLIIPAETEVYAPEYELATPVTVENYEQHVELIVGPAPLPVTEPSSFTYTSPTTGEVIHVRYACAAPTQPAQDVENVITSGNGVAFNQGKHSNPGTFDWEFEIPVETEVYFENYVENHVEHYVPEVIAPAPVETYEAPIHIETPSETVYIENHVETHVSHVEQYVPVAPAPVENYEVPVEVVTIEGHVEAYVPHVEQYVPIAPAPVETHENYEAPVAHYETEIEVPVGHHEESVEVELDVEVELPPTPTPLPATEPSSFTYTSPTTGEVIHVRYACAAPTQPAQDVETVVTGNGVAFNQGKHDNSNTFDWEFEIPVETEVYVVETETENYVTVETHENPIVYETPVETEVVTVYIENVEHHYATGYIPAPVEPVETITVVETYEEEYHYATGYIPAPETITIVETFEEEYHYATGLIIPEAVEQHYETVTVVETHEEEYHYATGYVPEPVEHIETIVTEVEIYTPVEHVEQIVPVAPVEPEAYTYVSPDSGDVIHVRYVCGSDDLTQAETGTTFLSE